MNPIGVTTRRFRFAALLAAALTTAAPAAAGAAGATAASAGPAPQRLRPPLAPAAPTAPDPAADAGRYEVRLRSGRFVPAADRRSLPAAAARRLGPDASFHALAQLESVPSPAQRKAMAEAGVRLLGYLPRMTWRATVRAGLDPDDPRLSGVRSLFALDPMAKVDPSIAGPVSGPAGLVVRFQEDVPVARREAIVRRSGATIVGRADSVAAIVILAPAEAVAGLAAEDEVAWVDAAPAMLQPANDGVRAALGVESLWTDPVRPLTGAGLDVLVFDQGRVDELHDDLAGRVVVGDPVGVANHSTHVAGTLAGNGARSGGLYAGAAPSSRVISYALGSFNAGIFMHSNPGDLEADFAAAISTHGADLANLSLGSNLRLNNFPCALYGDYAVTEALLDGIVAGSLGPRFPIVVAGGNERPAPACSLSYASTAPPAGAKNVLSVGAVHSDSLAMTSFSAWGPTDDGRLKPDLVGPGCQSSGDGAVTSTYGGNAYGTLCGTSQAAPAV
ncbi:MAG TPA: S8 family serine peptidase, partial [Candidatus Polarisedimenticolia bacterium]|nr:S8 family serine peptidase [Candidatus Polarisedimenticolia bacterium]